MKNSAFKLAILASLLALASGFAIPALRADDSNPAQALGDTTGAQADDGAKPKPAKKRHKKSGKKKGRKKKAADPGTPAAAPAASDGNAAP
jgi:hypothetical protein